jgi:hypothetical protein
MMRRRGMSWMKGRRMERRRMRLVAAPGAAAAAAGVAALRSMMRGTMMRRM